MSDDIAAEEQFIDFKCPCCGDDVSFPLAVSASVQECVNCNEPIIIPSTGGVGRKIPLPIETEKLTLRKFNGEDWKDLLKLFSDDEFFAASPFKLDGEEQIARWLAEDAMIRLTTPDVPFILAVQSKENGQVIGCVSLSFSDDARRQAIIYIVIHREAQKRGLGTEAARGVLDFCFNGIALHRIQGFCDSTNIAAIRLWEKAGLRREGEFVQDHKARDAWVNTIAYAMLRKEFKPGPGQ